TNSQIRCQNTRYCRLPCTCKSVEQQTSGNVPPPGTNCGDSFWLSHNLVQCFGTVLDVQIAIGVRLGHEVSPDTVTDHIRGHQTLRDGLLYNRPNEQAKTI